MKLFLFLLTCLLAAPANSADRELRVGVIASLSGNWSAFGDMTIKGLELARAEIEQDGKTKIILEVEDSQEHSSGAGAISAYRVLRAKGVQLFIGPSGTPGGLAMAPAFVQDSAVIISPSVAVESFHLAGRNIFNSQGAFEISSRLLANRAFQDGIRKMAIFSSQQPYENAQADAFEREFIRLGGIVVAREDPLSEKTDLRSEAVRVAAKRPEGVFLAGYNQMATSSKALKQLGFHGAKYAPLMDRSRFEGAQGGLDGLIFTKLGKTEERFIEGFKHRFGREPDYPADFAHDALIALHRAIALADSESPEKVTTALLSVKFEGASGSFRFDSNGCAVRNPTLWKVARDEFVSLASNVPLNKPLDRTGNQSDH